MREKWARLIALFTGLLVLLLAITFALLQNPREIPATTPGRQQASPIPPPASSTPDPQRIAIGRRVYQQQSCARCHSIAAEGNPRNPLDGVGSRRSNAELRDWIIGAEALQGEIPPRAFQLKQVYRELPSDELDALVIYLQAASAKP